MGDMADDADAWAEGKEGLEDLRSIIKGNILGAAIDRHRQVLPVISNVDEHVALVIKTKQQQYMLNKTSPVGATIACPNCGQKFIKNRYNTVFCNNQKTSKRSNNCKDRYWNYTDLNRRDRAINGV